MGMLLPWMNFVTLEQLYDYNRPFDGICKKASDRKRRGGRFF